MTDNVLHNADMAFLIARPEFRRFLFRSIQLAGILDHMGRGTNGSDGRDLAFAEGRRSLGFEILRMADAAQPAALQHPQCLITLVAALQEEIQSPKEEKIRGRNRYGSDDDDDD